MSFSFCQYKNSLGIPHQGIHSHRFMGLAILDVIGTFVGGLLIAYLFKLSYFWTCISLFVLGIFLHRLFCVRTTIDKILFPS